MKDNLVKKRAKRKKEKKKKGKKKKIDILVVSELLNTCSVLQKYTKT